MAHGDLPDSGTSPLCHNPNAEVGMESLDYLLLIKNTLRDLLKTKLTQLNTWSYNIQSELKNIMKAKRKYKLAKYVNMQVLIVP